MKNRLFILLIIFFFITRPSLSQTLTLLDSITIDEPQCVSIDRLSNIYLAGKKGSIKKYSPSGKLVSEYSPQKSGPPTLLEAWNPLRVFAFYEHFQEYLFLDRFLVTNNRFNVRPITDYAALMAPSIDNNLWVIDQANFGLKKYNLSFSQVTIETSFDLLLNRDNFDISCIREYQNMVFLADRQTGILVFDNLGNYLYTLPYKKVDYFNFDRNQIYFLQGSSLVFLDIYNKKEKAHINLSGQPKFVLYGDKRLWLFFKKYLKTYKIDT